MRIFRAILTFIFLIITLLIVLSATLVYFSKFGNKTYFGKKVRGKVVRFPLIVKLVNLNNSGDALFEYLDSEKPIKVEIYSAYGKHPSKNIEGWARDMIRETTGSSIEFYEHLDRIDPKVSYTDSDLNGVRDSLRDSLDFSPKLYIIYLPSYYEDPMSVGVVLHRDTIFIFKDTIDSLSENSGVLEKLEESTLLHEWGHVLGLVHIEDDSCIMSEKVEVYDRPPIGTELVTDYCPEELREINTLK